MILTIRSTEPIVDAKFELFAQYPKKLLAVKFEELITIDREQPIIEEPFDVPIDSNGLDVTVIEVKLEPRLIVLECIIGLDPS